MISVQVDFNLAGIFLLFVHIRKLLFVHYRLLFFNCFGETIHGCGFHEVCITTPIAIFTKMRCTYDKSMLSFLNEYDFPMNGGS